MKKFILLILMVASIYNMASAQVASTYAWSQTTTTYSAISGGTSHTTGATDDVNYTANIGFPFVYNGTTYNSVNVSTNGHINFGTAIGTTEYFPLNSGTSNGVIAAMARDLVGSGSGVLRSQTIGTAPNRIFVTQWSSWQRYITSAQSDVLNFQIRLHETSQLVEIVYGSCTATSTTGTVQVGLRGSATSDYNNRMGTWGGSTAGTANNSNINTSNSLMPANGLTYRWTPTQPVIATPTAANSGPVCAGATANLTATGLAPYGQVASLSGTQTIGSGIAAQTAISNTFTIEFWANPTSARNSTTQSNSGTIGAVAGTQSYAIWPDNRGASAAGAGISVGTNGVSVGEHGDNYLPTTLVYDIPLSGWTHIAVVYNARTPTLYINGGLVKTGVISGRATVYPSSGTGGSYGYYAGQLDNIRIFSGARSQADIRASMFRSAPTGASGGTLSHQYTFDAGTTNADIGTNNPNGGATFSTASFFTYTWAGVSAPAASTATTQTTGALSSTQSYTVTPSVSGNLIPGTASAATTVTVNDLPQGALTSNSGICSGVQGKLTFTASAGTGPYTVVYNDGTANRTQTNVTSGTPFNPFTNPLTTASYTLVSVTGANSCVRTTGFTDGSETLTVISCGVPTISGFSPASACFNSGASIVVSGTNMASVNSATINGVAATITATTTTSVTLTLPASATGTGNIYVSSPSGNTTSAGTFTVNALATPGTFQYANASTQTICTGATISCADVTAPTAGSGSLSVVWYCGEEVSPGAYGNWRESTLGNVSGTSSSSNLNAAAGGGSGMATSLNGYNPRLDFPAATKFLIIRRGYNSNCGPCVGGCQDQIFYLNLLALPTGGSVPAASFCSVNGAGTVSVTGVSTATQYAWALPGALSGTSTTASINLTGTAVGSYTVTVTPQNTSGALVCPASPITGTVNITASPGNPAVFGSNTWNVYAYLGANRDNLGAVAYAGYYTQNLSPQQGFNSQAAWVNTSNPSTAAGYNGCPLPDDGFTFVHKRQGFTPGYYSLSIDNWDDGSILYINGSSTASFQAPAWSGDAATNGFAAPYVLSSCTYLDANSTIEFRTAEGGGGANAQLTITALSGISASAAATNQTTCNNGTGSIALTRSGGSGSYTYSWTGPNGFTSATQSPTALGSGTYNVTVTDAGCPALTATASATITAPWSANAGPDLGICVGNSGTLTGSVTGTIPTIVSNIFTENFDGNNGTVVAGSVTTSATTNHKWQIRNTTSSYTTWRINNASCAIAANSLSLYDSYNGYTCDYDWDGAFSQIAYCNNAINAGAYTNLNLTFSYKVGGERVGSTLYDYMTVVYSTNGGTSWTPVNIGNYSTPANVMNNGGSGLTASPTSSFYNTTGSGTFALPAALDNTSFLLGFRWINDAGTGIAPGMVIDNIVVSGTGNSTPAYTWSGPGTISPSTTTQSPTVSTAGTYTLSVSAAGCTSTDQAVVITTSSLSGPSVTANSGCRNTAITLSASGAAAGESYKWYDAASAGNLLQTGGATYNTPLLASSTTYYVTRYNTTTNCESPRVAVTATVNACYVAEFVSMNTGNANWCAGETRNVTVTIKNVGTQPWTNSSPDINIGAKWNGDADHNVRVDANGLAPGATQTYILSMTAPTTTGANNIGFDVVREGDCWFRGNSGGCGPGNANVPTPSAGGTGYLSATQTILAIPTGGAIAAVNYCSATGAGTATITGASNATQYAWSLPSGLSGTSTTASINLTGSTPGSYTVSVTPQNVSGVTCPAAAPVTGTVNVIATPSAPASVTASGAACNSFTLSWSVAANASGYEIQVSTDAGFGTSVGSYNGSTDAGNVTSATIGGLAINTTYYVRVRARNGAIPCRSGFTNLNTISITTTTVPAQPGAVSGNSPVCPSTSQTYSVAAVAGATSYTWTLPSGWSGTSTTNSITATTSTTSGNVSVVANNACGAGASSALTVTVTQIPTQPGTITGATTSVCQNSSQTYSIAAVAGATSYTWTLPSGWSGSSTTTSITATAGPTAVTGNVSVTASNSCGTSTARILAVTDIKPAPIANAGPDIVLPCTTGSVTLNGSSNNVSLLNEDFGTTNYEITNATSVWRIFYRTGSSPANRTQWHITNNTTTFPCLGTGSGLTMYDPLRPNNCDYAYDDGAMDEVAYNVSTIDARYYTGVNLTFDYKVSGEYETGINTVWDYMQVVYSTNGGSTWTSVNAGNNGGSYTFDGNNGVNNGFFCLTAGGVSSGSANINLAALAGNQFLLGFRWKNDAATGYVPGFWVDNIKVNGSATYSWGSNPAGGIVSGGTTNAPVINQPGTYTVTVTGGNGCTAADAMVVTRLSLPAVPVVSNNSPKCIGSTVQLTAAGLAPAGQVANLTGTQTIGSASFGNANNFTMELWVNPTATRPSTTEQNGVNDISGVANQRYAIMPLNYNTDAGAGISVGTNGVSVFEHSAGYLPSLLVYDAPIIGWTHIAVVYTNKTPSLYVNGNFIKTGLTSQKPNVFASAGTGSSYGYYEGALDNIRIWSSSRTATEISNNLYLETPTSSTGLVAHYNMNGNTNASTGTNLTNGGATFSTPNYFTYAWAGPNAPAAGTAETQTTSAINAAGTSNYTVTASLGYCPGVASAATAVVINPLATASISGNTALCAGGSTRLTATGGGTYLWSTGATTAAINVSPASTTGYTVTVTAGGCTATANSTVTVTPLPIAAIGGTTTICAGGGTTLTASGGGTYVWSTGATTAAINVSPATTTGYTVTVTTATGGCTATAAASVTVTALPTAAISGTNTICAGGSSTFTATGGGTYVWSTGATTAAIPVSTAGTYTVTVTTNSCTATATRTLTVTPLPTASISGNTGICAGSSTTLTAAGGGTYVWSTGATTAAISASSAGTYTVTVTTNSCTATASSTVTVTPLPTASISGNTAICAGGSTTLTAAGGGTYVWSTGATTAAISASTAGTYTVTVTSNGCTATASSTVTVTALPTASISGSTGICAGGSSTFTATGGGTYLWSTGATTAAITVSTGATYTVTVTSNGCTATATRTLTVNPAPTATITGTDTICPGNSTTFTASGGASYAWSNGANTASINVTTAGIYIVTVTTGSCTATASSTLYLGGSSTINLVSNVANICSGGYTSIALSASEPGTTFNWTRTNAAQVAGDASGNSVASPISVQLSSGTSQTTQFSIQAQSPSGCTSNILLVNVTVQPGTSVSITEHINDLQGCSGDTFKLVAQATGGTGVGSYQWQRFINGVWINEGNNSATLNTGAILNTNAVEEYASYRVLYTTNGAGCGTSTSPQFDLTVFPKPKAEPEFDDCVARIIGAKFSYVILANSGAYPPFSVVDSTNLGAVRMYSDIDTTLLIYRLPQDGTTAPYVFTTTDANGCSVTSTFNREITYPQNIVTATTSGNTVNDCLLKGWNEWEHFQNPVNKDEVIVSVNPKGIDLGRVSVTSYVDSEGDSITNSNPNSCVGIKQAAMRRHYVITSSLFAPGEAFTNGANVGVRLYFSDADFADLSNRAAANDDANNTCTTDDNITDMTQLFVTKYSDNTFNNTENGTYADNDPASGIYRVFGPSRPASGADYVGPLSNIQDNGFDAVFQPNQATGHNYVELDVTEFSEFWLHGSQSGSPLPVKMLFIEAKGIDNTFIRVDWATSTEIDNWKFEVERSVDGATFTKVGEVIGHATSTERNDYLFNDLGVTQGIRYYYRLKQIDFDSKFEYSPIVSAKLEVDDDFRVGEFIPNPTSGRSTLTFKTKANKDVKAQVYDYLGQVVMEQSKTIRNADNTMYFDFDKLAAGTYMVNLTTADKSYSKRVVLTR